MFPSLHRTTTRPSPVAQFRDVRRRLRGAFAFSSRSNHESPVTPGDELGTTCHQSVATNLVDRMVRCRTETHGLLSFTALTHPPLPTFSFQTTATRVVLRTTFSGKQTKTVTRVLPGARTNGGCVKTSASWNPFAQNSSKAGIVGSQGRDDYEPEDVEYYFNYMGILAVEGSNDRMDLLVNSGKHPIDIILLFAAAEGDTPKIEEILEAGANANVTDLDGNTPLMLAGKNNPEKKAQVEAMLKAAM